MLPPREVVRLAHANGCTLLALTDHDHTGGLAEAPAEAAALGMGFVNGVEIGCPRRCVPKRGNAAAAIAAMPASKPFIGTKKPNTMRSSANGQHSKPKKTPND